MVWVHDVALVHSGPALWVGCGPGAAGRLRGQVKRLDLYLSEACPSKKSRVENEEMTLDPSEIRDTKQRHTPLLRMV